MAVVPICSKIFYKDHAVPFTKSIRERDKGVAGDWISIQEGCRCFSSVSGDTGRSWHAMYHTSDYSMKANTRLEDNAFYMLHNRRSTPFQTIIEVPVLHRAYNIETEVKSTRKYASQRYILCKVSHASESSNNKTHLKALDSYFSKLHNEENQQQTSFICLSDFETAPIVEDHQMEPSSNFPDKMTKSLGRNDQFSAKKGLGSLENYLRKVNTEADSQKTISSSLEDEANESNVVRTSHFVREDERSEGSKLNSDLQLETKDDWSRPENSQGLQPYDETSDLYLICLLASINIAVFIFEIASPIRNSDVELLSLPSLYGAKINQLILVGEWWRLVTPMFLHSGGLHVAFGCWALLTFGPQVCRGYGSFTFLLIYILGGISGNLTSFIYTPEPTVGGTGPVFAMIGAWMIYQIQNKDVIAKEVSESMFQKAVIATVLSFVLSNFGPIDDWTHFGAICAGIVYGFLTCPTLQLDDASPKTSQEEGVTLVRRYADPCKSLIMFTLFIAVLISSLLFFLEPPLGTLELNSLV